MPGAVVSQESPFISSSGLKCIRLFVVVVGFCTFLFNDRILERKAMTNLDTILKSRDITLLTKVHLAKAMVFPVVMHGCENWTIKKAEHPRIDAFEQCVGEDS